MSMMDGDNLRQLSQRFGNTLRQGRKAQRRALMAAFAKIDDDALRGQLVLILEAVASSPRILAKLKARTLGHDSAEPAGNVIYLHSIR
jgi:hypothetical protein